MAKQDAQSVAALLMELSRRSALAGGNPYRVRAYARAAESIATLTVPLAAVVEEGRLRALPGIGETIADIVEKLHRTGTHPSLEELRREVPPGVVEMLAIPGLRPEKVLKLYRELGLTSLGELEAAARADRLAKVKGLGPALQRKILEGLEIRQMLPAPATSTVRPSCSRWPRRSWRVPALA